MIPASQTELAHARESRSGAAPYSVCMLFPGHVLTDHLPFGDGLVAHGFISEIARRGHRVHVVAQRADLRDALPGNVTLHVIGARKRGLMQRLRFVVRSRSIVRRIEAGGGLDIVHQLNPVCNGMSLGVAGLGVPVVLGTYVANWPSDGRERAGAFARVRRVAVSAARDAVAGVQERLAAGFLVTTKAALSRFTSVSRVADRIYWLPHGMDVSKFSPPARRPSDRQAVLFVANLAEKKGIFTLLDAFERVSRRLPEATLVVAGGGELSAAVERRVAEMPCSSRVTLLGRVDRDDVPALMAQASVYCLPSFGEPYATTVIEAMACGVPLVVTNAGGLADMVDDGGGRRVEPGNAEQLAGALTEILSSPELQERMGHHNRQVAEDVYDWPRVGEKLESVYADVLQRARVRR